MLTLFKKKHEEKLKENSKKKKKKRNANWEISRKTEINNDTMIIVSLICREVSITSTIVAVVTHLRGQCSLIDHSLLIITSVENFKPLVKDSSKNMVEITTITMVIAVVAMVIEEGIMPDTLHPAIHMTTIVHNKVSNHSITQSKKLI